MSYSWFTDYLQGRCADAYNYLGAHLQLNENGEEVGVVFRVYAPMAKSIEVLGDFNSWALGKNIMTKVDMWGLWEVLIKDAKVGQRYKYHILGCDGYYHDKADPVGFQAEVRPGTCSIIYDNSKFKFEDEEWLKKRERNFNKPVSIYEMHVGSWRLKPDGGSYTYEEIAKPLIEYILQMNYTHVEFMPLYTYPFDGSWGYQPTGYYSADGRYGSPDGLKYLINELHKAGIGVILDMVPVHFATDPHGLEKFDGSNLYEGQGDMEYSQWGSKNFDLGKDPVRSFLISSADYFVTQFHVDGVRIDAVSNIIYYQGDGSRGVNGAGVYFAREFNRILHDRHPDLMTIAEDSSAYPSVTKGFSEQSLCFDYKWDMGWMNDTLKYYAKDPFYKSYEHGKILFSMAYFYSENFVLPLSHDEVVHGKGTIVNKMWGDYDQKFALARNLYAYQYAHPGHKLNFMGNELGDFDEWSEKKGLPWNLLDYPKHSGFQRYIHDLNCVLKAFPAMYEGQFDPKNFQWILADDSSQSVLVFQRSTKNQTMVFIFNMTPNFYSYFDIGVPLDGQWDEVIDSDKGIYGGWNQYNGAPLFARPDPYQNQPYRITIKLPSFGAIFLCHNKDADEEAKRNNTGSDPADVNSINGDVKVFINKNKNIG